MNRITHLVRRAAPLLKLAREYTAAHILARLMAAISGLILVRLLPVNEYGLYTLALTAFTFICTFSDLGATETLSFFRWRALKRNKPWVQYFHAVVRFRKTIFLFGFVAASLYVIASGRRVGTDWFPLLAGVLLMGLGAWFAIQSGINTYVLKLEQRFRAAYAVDISTEGVKLLGAGLIWLLGLTTAIAGMVSIAVGALVAALLSYKLLDQTGRAHIQTTRRRADKNRRLLLSQILPTLPGSIHFALQGVLVAGLAAYFGTIENVAEVGALGRLGVLIGIIAGFTGSVFVPRLLAITDEKVFLRRYLQWWLTIIAFGLILLAAVAVFPNEVLWLLGGNYSGLYQELLISAATAVVASWLSYSFAINRARGWMRFQQYSVPYIVVGQIVLLMLLDMSSTSGVLWFAFGSIGVGFTYQLILNIAGFRMSYRKN